MRCRWGRFRKLFRHEWNEPKARRFKNFPCDIVRNLTFVKTLSCMGKEEVAMAPIFLWWTLLVLA